MVELNEDCKSSASQRIKQKMFRFLRDKGHRKGWRCVVKCEYSDRVLAEKSQARQRVYNNVKRSSGILNKKSLHLLQIQNYVHISQGLAATHSSSCQWTFEIVRYLSGPYSVWRAVWSFEVWLKKQANKPKFLFSRNLKPSWRNATELCTIQSQCRVVYWCKRQRTWGSWE